MAPKTLAIIRSVLPLIFGILSLSFVAASFASRDWVRQEYFPPELQPLDWKDPLYTIYRSPFVLCSATASRNESDILKYDINCHRYPVTGRGKTACQTPNETVEYSGVTGDWRMCQQVHLSGNLVLGALIFVSIALATLLGLSIVFIPRALKEGQAVTSTTTEEAAEPSSHTHHKSSSNQHSPATVSTQPPITSLTVIIATYFLLAFLSVTAVLALLSQFYGILGLVQSQPDNGLWASLPLGAVQDQQTGDLHHAPWIQGNVLTIYLSLGWLFGALAAGAIGGAWLGAFRRV